MTATRPSGRAGGDGGAERVLGRSGLPAPRRAGAGGLQGGVEAGPLEKGWAPSRPNDAIDRGAWWSIYRDPVLDGLERQIDISNQNLKAAEAAFRQAEALVAEARAGLFPTLDARRLGDALAAPAASGSSIGGGTISDNFQTALNASWVPDLWGSGAAPDRKQRRQRAGQRGDAGQRAAVGAGGARHRLYAAARRRRIAAAADGIGQGVHPGAADRHQPVQERHRRPVGGRSGAGAARGHEGAADRGRGQPRPVRACDRGADRQAAGRA